jgi:membrane associated rhomboid family serine protease
MNYRYRNTTISFGGPLTPVVRNIIIACVFVYLVQLVAGDTITYFFSLTPVLLIQKFYFWQLFTYLFLHDRHGILHLLFNMLSLFMFGCELERYWGSKRFLQFYVLTGVGAGLCVLLIPSNYYTSTIGASGAIYGVLLAYGLTFPDRVLYLYMLFPLQARYFVIIIGAITFLTTLSSSNTGISNAAHLGGMIFAYLYLKSQKAYRSRPQIQRFNLKEVYYRWKLRRARRKFEVYLNKKDPRRDKDEMIH